MMKVLQNKIEDILESIHQDSEGNCPFCGAKDFPVNGNKKGYEEVNPEDAEEYNIEHFDDCIVLDLEKILDKIIDN